MANMKTEAEQLDLLTRSMVGHYRLGSEKIALYLAATIFESFVNSKLRLKGWDEGKIERVGLDTKIDELEKADLGTDSLFTYQDIFQKYHDYGQVKIFSRSVIERENQVEKRLHNFRQLRNKVIHNQKVPLFAVQSNVIEDWIIYLWSELAHDSFEKAYGKRKGRESVIDTLPEHTADYMIRAIDEVEFLKKDRARGHAAGKTVITPKDFDNLFELRGKLVFLKNYLSDWLPEEADFLQTDILTTIDTTSAYIWMPLVSQKLADDSRHGVYDCSVSILATPLDLRVYMDFGGFTRDQRKAYYDFLDGSPEYETLIEDLKGKPGLEVFDIDWYSAISNRSNLSDWLDQREQALAGARDKIKGTAKPENSPITWNRCLHGYVISKYDLAEGGVIDFAMIEPKLRDIIALYQAFNTYKDRIKDKGK